MLIYACTLCVAVAAVVEVLTLQRRYKIDDRGGYYCCFANCSLVGSFTGLSWQEVC